MTTEFTEV
jgi:hypothetical protein